MTRATAARGSATRITVRPESFEKSSGTSRHPASDAAAAFRARGWETKERSSGPASSSVVTRRISASPLPSNTTGGTPTGLEAWSRAARSRTFISAEIFITSKGRRFQGSVQKGGIQGLAQQGEKPARALTARLNDRRTRSLTVAPRGPQGAISGDRGQWQEVRAEGNKRNRLESRLAGKNAGPTIGGWIAVEVATGANENRRRGCEARRKTAC